MKRVISLALILVLAVAFCTVSVSAADDEATIASITFSTEDAATKDLYQGGSTVACLTDGDTLAEATIPTFSTAGILLVQNLFAKDADKGPAANFSFTIELSEVANILAVDFATYTEADVCIGLIKDGKVAVEYSLDGTDYTFSGDYEVEVTESGSPLVEEFSVELDAIVEAKFVKLTFSFGEVPPYQGNPTYWADTYGYVVAEFVGFTEFGIETFVPEDEPSEEPAESSEPAEESDPLLGEKTNVAKGKSYEFAGNLADSYTDDGNELTDGVIPETASYSEPGIVGFNAGSDFYKENGFAQIVIDLGSVQDITEISVVASNLGSAGVNAPGSIVYEYSTNGTDFTELGEGTYDKDLSETNINVTNTITANKKIRYIKIKMIKGEGSGNWMMISEVIAMNNGTATPLPGEESKAPVTPKTGDAGMIALAIVSVITLAGVVVVKKSK